MVVLAVELVAVLEAVLVADLEAVLLVVVREKEDKKADVDLGVEMREGIVAWVRSDLWWLV